MCPAHDLCLPSLPSLFLHPSPPVASACMLPPCLTSDFHLQALLGQSNDRVLEGESELRKEQERRRIAQERVYVIEGEMLALVQERKEEKERDEARKVEWEANEERWREREREMQEREAALDVHLSVARDHERALRARGKELRERESDLRALQVAPVWPRRANEPSSLSASACSCR